MFPKIVSKISNYKNVFLEKKLGKKRPRLLCRGRGSYSSPVASLGFPGVLTKRLRNQEESIAFTRSSHKPMRENEDVVLVLAQFLIV